MKRVIKASVTSNPYDSNETMKQGKHKYHVMYNTIDTSPEADPVQMLKEFKFQITVISPYDDAQYEWCKGENGTVNIYKGSKLVDESIYMTSDDWDVENSEWCEAVLRGCVELLEESNSKIKPRMVHN